MDESDAKTKIREIMKKIQELVTRLGETQTELLSTDVDALLKLFEPPMPWLPKKILS